MQARFIQDGDSIDYTPTTDVAAGEVVVQKDLIGVAVRPIAANMLGSLAVTGVFDFSFGEPGPNPAGTWIFWDTTAHSATTNSAAGYPKLGLTVANADSGATSVRVRLGQ